MKTKSTLLFFITSFSRMIIALFIGYALLLAGTNLIYADDNDKAWEETDLLIKSETPIEFKRIYNETDSKDMGLGIHFNHNYNIYYEDKGDSFRFHMGDGNVLYVNKDASGNVIADKDRYKSLAFEDGKLIIKFTDNKIYTFGEHKHIKRINDNGKILKFYYESYTDSEVALGKTLHRLTEISSQEGRIKLRYNEDNKLVKLIDNFDRKVEYFYNDDYLTTCEKSDDNTLYYKYDEFGKIINKSIVKAGGSQEMPESGVTNEEKEETPLKNEIKSQENMKSDSLDENMVDELGEEVSEDYYKEDSGDDQIAYYGNHDGESKKKFKRRYGRKYEKKIKRKFKRNADSESEKDENSVSDEEILREYSREDDLKSDKVTGNSGLSLIENNWLALCRERTFEGRGRIVNIPQSADPSKWAMKESQSTINYYARRIIGGRNQVKIGSNRELLDKDNRYWVAVGPKVMNPYYYPCGKLLAECMNYGTLLDVELKDDAGEVYYVKAVVGDAKAHTYPNGIYQTGTSFDNPSIYLPYNDDGSIIEFMGDAPIYGLNKYKITKIIVYDQQI